MNQSLVFNRTDLTLDNNSCDRFSSPSNDSDLRAQFFEVAFGSGIYMSVVAFITVLANSLLLLVFCVDPYKTFRNPTSVFLIGLAFADLMTGLVQEPIFASCFLLGYFGHPATKQHCPQLLRFGRILASVTMNTSFIIVLALTATQLIVITSPLRYAPFVTNKMVAITVVVIYAYTITFGLLNLIELPDPDTFMKIDLFLHSFFIVYLSIACYVLLYRAFRRQMASLVPLGRQRSRAIERNFVVINFLLIILVFVCTQPSAILALYKHYWLDTRNLAMESVISQLMVDNILYLKFMLDPFLYAWRISKHRHALRTVLTTVA